VLLSLVQVYYNSGTVCICPDCGHTLELRAISVSQELMILTVLGRVIEFSLVPALMFSGLDYPYRPAVKTDTCKINVCINELECWKLLKT
jgi:hypothetical protein